MKKEYWKRKGKKDDKQREKEDWRKVGKSEMQKTQMERHDIERWNVKRKNKQKDRHRQMLNWIFKKLNVEKKGRERLKKGIIMGIQSMITDLKRGTGWREGNTQKRGIGHRREDFGKGINKREGKGWIRQSDSLLQLCGLTAWEQWREMCPLGYSDLNNSGFGCKNNF